MKRSAAYKVDLTEIAGEGDFPCPNCGAIISPEDETETVYTILETKMKKESLEALIIQCNRCGSKIHLVGFLSATSDKAEIGTAAT
jgi:DNA-directed RNA polymerase subunit RPC12/RpoP